MRLNIYCRTSHCYSQNTELELEPIKEKIAINPTQRVDWFHLLMIQPRIILGQHMQNTGKGRAGPPGPPGKQGPPRPKGTIN